jgi:hypothetical protein
MTRKGREGVNWDSSDGNVGESERYFNHLQTAPEWDENVGSLVSVFTGLLGGEIGGGRNAEQKYNEASFYFFLLAGILILEWWLVLVSIYKDISS